MTVRFKHAARVGLLALLVGLALPAARSQGAAGCGPETPAAAAIPGLAAEAEATGMPEAVLSRLLAAGYRGTPDIEVLRGILCALVDAEDRGLPPGTIIETIEEGLGKRVPLPMVLAVVEDRIRDLDFARRLLATQGEEGADNPKVERLARALTLKVTRAEAAQLFDARVDAPVEMRLTAAEILGYGRALGLAPDLLDRVVATGLAHRAFTPDWAYFAKVVSAARKRGIPDTRTVEAALDVLMENGSVDELAGELNLDLRGLAAPAEE
jgi:hypothetical protein